MSDGQLKDLVKYRMEQAKETIIESEILQEKSSYRGSLNRSYYAMFYAVLALLAVKKLGTSKHSGALSLFDKEFVKAGIFPKELSKNLHLAFDLRQTYDYGEVLQIEKDSVDNILKNAKAFVAEIENYLRLNGYFQS